LKSESIDVIDNLPVRVRFAPSPTGHTHIGGGRTALYNYLLARKTGGTFILRIEDTDRKRFVKGAEKELIDSLHWLGIEWDEGPGVGGAHGPYYQTQRKEIYQEYARKLIESGHAYYCFCSSERLEQVRKEQLNRKENPRYDGLCRRLDPNDAQKRVKDGERHVIRFKVPASGSVKAIDLLRGEITVDTSAIDDHVIVRSDGLALYHLAAMVDDHLMGITHVIRGSEWLSTFPLHALIVRAFGWQEPNWVHLSVLVKSNGKKIAKRDNDQASSEGYSFFIKDLEHLAYIPEAVVNWTALMGWSYDDHTEFFTMQDMIEKFSLKHLNPAPAVVNFKKLDYFNGLHIRHLSSEDLKNRLVPFITRADYKLDEEKLYRAIPIIQPRLVTLDDVIPVAGFLFKENIEPNPADLVGDNLTPGQSTKITWEVYELLKRLPALNQEAADQPLRNLAEQSNLKAGQVFGIIRNAVTGQKNSPPIFECMEIIGKEKVLERIKSAAEILEKM
jgi:glutamyl-tRNA synthetase